MISLIKPLNIFGTIVSLTKIKINGGFDQS